MEVQWVKRNFSDLTESHSDSPAAPPRAEPESAVAFDFEIPEVIQEIFKNRGMHLQSEVNDWLNPSVANLSDPLTIPDMKLAADRMAKAFLTKERICVYADFDLDGTSGLALMMDGLAQLGYTNLTFAQPKRLSQGYGFHDFIVEELKLDGVSLIVTVDVGITAMKAVEKASELGIDVIITDHHQPEETLPAALAVVNPNRKDDTSGLGYLCGAGVAYYLLRALKRELVNQKLIDAKLLDLKSLLDCFTIGTLTDMVPLIKDNRALVKVGLKVLETTTRPGLRCLLNELDLNQRALTGQDVAIRFAPKLNALSRMELGVRPIDIYMATSMKQAEALMETVFDNNNTRVQLQEVGENEALRQMEAWPHSGFAVASSKKFHRGVVGLIATKLSGEMNLPSFVGAIDEDGVITGSARMPQGRSDSLLTAMSNAGEFLNRFGGHDMAAGFELHESAMLGFIDKLNEHFKTVDIHGSKVFSYDAELPISELDETMMGWLETVGPFGAGFEMPIFCIRNISVVSVNVLKSKHLKIKVSNEQNKKTFDMLYFSAPKEIIDNPPQFGDRIDVIGEVQWNYFSGRKSIQLLLKDFRLKN